jgi:hypothetical protein
MLKLLNFSWVAICVVLVLPVGAQESSTRTLEEWKRAKQSFLTDINKSLEDIFSQLNEIESIARAEGDLPKLKQLNELRSAFAEKGEIPSTLKREKYDLLRKSATETLVAKKKELVTAALQSKEDSVAEVIDQEFQDLSDPLLADIQARWASAIEIFLADMEKAKSVIQLQLNKQEAEARERGNVKAVEEIKLASEAFSSKGVLPKRVSAAVYEAQVKKAADRLAQINKSLVKSLLMAQRDTKARELGDSLERIISPGNRPESALAKSTDSRKSWRNDSYKGIFRHVTGANWEELDSKGKLLRKVKELDRNDKFIEILLVDRQHLVRLYSDHADIHKDGRWQWVANGAWEK